MQYFVSGKEMKALDTATIAHYKVPELVLMEQAAFAFVNTFFNEIYQKSSAPVLVVCGNGNNGADGIAIARLLNQKGVTTFLYIPFPDKSGTNSFQTQKEIYEAYHYPIVDKFHSSDSYSYIIDGLFGIGLSREINGDFALLIENINQSNAIKVAIDMPSGVSSENGSILGTALKANATITFSFGKIGQYLWPGVDYCGNVYISPIGITNDSWLNQKPSVISYTPSDLSLLPKRIAHSNKGTYGKVLVVAGTTNMAGAAYLCAKAAYCTGSGLVKIYTPEENRIPLQTLIPEAVLCTYSSKQLDIEQLREQIKWCNVIVVGPGIGINKISAQIVAEILSHYDKPKIIDADAINILAKDNSLGTHLSSNCILTPHLGEMSRLIQKPISDISQNLIQTAKDFADTNGAICVLKDAHTITAIPNLHCYLNTSGNNGMATGGSGDTLAGIIAGLIAQGCSLELGASLGVYLHGLAGNEAFHSCGTYGMMAEDIIKGLKDLLKRVEEHE